MKGKICFCPATLRLIAKELVKTASGERLWRRLNKFKTSVTTRTRRKGKRGDKMDRGFNRFAKTQGFPKRKKRFSRKQLAAQRLFAKRARAGTLRKGRRRRSR